mmetsp:Transcript_134781/g.252028  ORF Transcript_134781/g.252028 Transcript_134781/m.252028 type:complete len:200 (-) Transcript_134781:1064-1663(-)
MVTARCWSSIRCQSFDIISHLDRLVARKALHERCKIFKLRMMPCIVCCNLLHSPSCLKKATTILLACRLRNINRYRKNTLPAKRASSQRRCTRFRVALFSFARFIIILLVALPGDLPPSESAVGLSFKEEKEFDASESRRSPLMVSLNSEMCSLPPKKGAKTCRLLASKFRSKVASRVRNVASGGFERMAFSLLSIVLR